MRLQTRWFLLLILIVGLGARLAYLAADPHGVRTESDDGEIARNILDGHGFSTNDRAATYVYELYRREHRAIDPATVDFKPLDRNAYFRPEVATPVGGALLLAGLWEITGSERYLPVQILQAILDAFVALLVYRIAMRLFERRRAALLAAALYAIYPPVGWSMTIASTDPWAVEFTIAIVACYLEAVNRTDNRRWLIACGILAGLGAYFRPNVLMIPAVLALATIPSLGWRTALRQALVASAVAAILLIPWTIRNYNLYHAFIPVRGAIGQNLWDGLGELPNDFGATLKDSANFARARRARPDLVPLTPAWDALFEHWSLQAIEHEPLYYVKSVARRALRSTVLLYDSGWMHRGTILPIAHPGESAAAASSRPALISFAFDDPLDLLQDALQTVVFLSAMLALVLTWRRRSRQHLVLVAVLLSILVPYVLIHLEPRYLLPAAFVYMIWIGLGIDLLAERVGRRLSFRLNARPSDMSRGSRETAPARPRQLRVHAPHEPRG